ncbi:hypothetical protein EVAR_82966_1 [Eumeta japonica]|uniref:Uncharacterized protein n=1 Tax=Eumeta variegata TaxID=151549 RepID=A0A4C1VPE2_EUMVA|nr:hypothetical protein EVAR_82966_1 [Eumeta japonica]
MSRTQQRFCDNHHSLELSSSAHEMKLERANQIHIPPFCIYHSVLPPSRSSGVINSGDAPSGLIDARPPRPAGGAAAPPPSRYFVRTPAVPRHNPPQFRPLARFRRRAGAGARDRGPRSESELSPPPIKVHNPGGVTGVLHISDGNRISDGVEINGEEQVM